MWNKLIALLLVSVLVAHPAMAQTAADVDAKLRRLEQELRAVQRKVFAPGDQRYFPGEPATNPTANAPDGGANNLVADMQVRLTALERTLRELNGRLEQMEFANRQLAEELGRFRADAEYRMNALEQPGAAFATPAAPRPDQPAPIPQASAPAAPAPAPEIASSTSVSGLPGDPDGTQAVAPITDEAAAAAQPSSAKAQFEAGFAALRAEDYAKAEREFSNFLAQHGDDPLASNAQYWLGKTYFVRKDYGRAAAAFLSGYQKYPDGDKAAESLLDLGVSLIELDQKQDACGAFAQLKSSYPNLADRISRRLASEQARAGCE